MASGKITVCVLSGTDEDKRFEQALIDNEPILWNDLANRGGEQWLQPKARRQHEDRSDGWKYDCEFVDAPAEIEKDGDVTVHPNLDRVHPEQRHSASPVASHGGLRYNKGKLRMELIPLEWMWALAEVLTKGSEKYAARNWELGLSDADTMGCLKRHIAKWESGESHDIGTDPSGRPNTGCHHMAIAAWNCLVLMTQELRGTGTRDLPRNAAEIISKLVVKP